MPASSHGHRSGAHRRDQVQHTGLLVRRVALRKDDQVGLDPEMWALLPAGWADRAGSTRVLEVGLDPTTALTGWVVAPPGMPATCTTAIAAAFGDGARPVAG